MDFHETIREWLITVEKKIKVEASTARHAVIMFLLIHYNSTDDETDWPRLQNGIR
jgi:hypothetical protein